MRAELKAIIVGSFLMLALNGCGNGAPDAPEASSTNNGPVTPTTVATTQPTTNPTPNETPTQVTTITAPTTPTITTVAPTGQTPVITNTAAPTPQSTPEATPEQPKINVSFDGSSMNLTLPQDVKFLLAGNPVTVSSLKSIKVFLWNDACVGWHVSGGKGLEAAEYHSPTNIIINGINPGGVGNWSMIGRDDTELFVDLSNLTASGIDYVIRDNQFYYGTAVTRDGNGNVVPNPSFTCPSNASPQAAQATNTVIEITKGKEITIKPSIVNGKLQNLVDSNPEEQILDGSGNVIPGYRIAWNGNEGWYPAGGKTQALQLPTTSFSHTAVPESGMPYLVRPDGTFIAFNTSRCTIIIDGADATGSAVSDGMIKY